MWLESSFNSQIYPKISEKNPAGFDTTWAK
jgi:hypothetical protein